MPEPRRALLYPLARRVPRRHASLLHRRERALGHRHPEQLSKFFLNINDDLCLFEFCRQTRDLTLLVGDRVVALVDRTNLGTALLRRQAGQLSGLTQPPPSTQMRRVQPLTS